MKTAIIVCSRTDSERLPNKPFRKINGEPIIELLIKNLQRTNLPIIIAVPLEQKEQYSYLKNFEGVHLFYGHAEDPLARMSAACWQYRVETAIRVTHDKFMIRERDILDAFKQFEEESRDYLFSSKFVPGTGFEIIKASLLAEAADKFKNIEFIGYAVRSIARNLCEFKPCHPSGNYRLLVDYPQDLQFFDVILSQIGNEASLEDVILYLNEHTELKQINQLPKLTVYTCAFNAEKWIEQCLYSVARQRMFNEIEYIVVDDFSSDKTTEIIAKFACRYQNVKWIRNSKNLGLASSSNVALKSSRGDYILRLDADDYFISITALEDLLSSITSEGDEIVYPDNYFGSLDKIQCGSECNHMGGAIVDKRALNHIKFTEGLRNYEGLDFWARAKDQLKIGYLKKPVFFYRQRDDSMSKTNLKDRVKTRKAIVEGYLVNAKA